MTGEELGFFLQETMDKGALDIYYTSIIMKKNRPAYELTLLCRPEDRYRFEKHILLETSTFGVRTTLMTRAILERNFESIKTNVGILKVKLGFYNNKLVKVTPEFESIKRLAKANQISYMAMYGKSIALIHKYYEI